MGWEEQMIKIIGVNKDAIRDQGSRKTWVLPFKLSAKPEESWEKHFYAVHARNTNLDKPMVKIIDDVMEVSFLETDSQQKVLDGIKVEVEAANVAFKELYLKKMKVQQDLRDYQDQQVTALQKVKDDSDKLKF